jgi:hypothetical protein
MTGKTMRAAAFDSRKGIRRGALAALAALPIAVMASCAQPPTDPEDTAVAKQAMCTDGKHCDVVCFEVDDKASHGYVTVSDAWCDYTITVDGEPAHIINGSPPPCEGDTVFTIPGNEEKNPVEVCVALENCSSVHPKITLGLKKGNTCTYHKATATCPP